MTPLSADTPITTLTFGDLETLIAQIVQQELQQYRPPEPSTFLVIPEQTYDETAPSILQIFADAATQVPDEDWDAVPQDASERFAHEI
ncbi:MAG: hypothetical protein F6J87_04455 [Spirulina sp. SIO3F2]|nr:hypothetical protein [Spirulina sp. SIO3F2]